MAKIIVSDRNPGTEQKRASLVKSVADSLGVLAEDVVLLPDGVGVSVVEVPAELSKAREKKDAQDKADKEKAEKEQADAERKAAEAKAKEEEAAAPKTSAEPKHAHVSHTSHARPKE